MTTQTTRKNEETKFQKRWQWLRINAVIILGVISCTVYVVQYNEHNRLQDKFDREINGVRQMITHSNETDFALRLSGLKQTATITENSMLEQYQQNLERIALAKQSGCTLPPHLVNPITLPAYVPAATIYLQEKKKIEEKETF